MYRCVGIHGSGNTGDSNGIANGSMEAGFL